MQIMIVRRRVAIISYNNGFFSQSYINCYATGHISHIFWYICLEGAERRHKNGEIVYFVHG